MVNGTAGITLQVMKWNFFSLLGLMVLIYCPNSSLSQIDEKATLETRALYKNLKKLSKNHILFGHQHATEYGHGWSGEEGRSDVKSVTGSHPAVIGIDLSGLSGRSPEAIHHTLTNLKKTVLNTFERGGVTTVAWHFSNPVTGGGFNWRDSVSAPAIELIKPGGSYHQRYKSILDTLALFFKSARNDQGVLAPMIFRPYHELDGGWFWWGKPHCTKEDFMDVWKFTVSYLRDSVGVHNLIYAFSPDCKFNTEEEYLERFPGDEWVDMVGMDNYRDFGRDTYNIDKAIDQLSIITEVAKKRNKVAAFTETGLESIPNPVWWTEVLMKAIRHPRIRLAYVLVWRNDIRSPTHYYAPFPGHSSVPDFLKFYQDPFTLFEADLKHIYKKKFLFF